VFRGNTSSVSVKPGTSGPPVNTSTRCAAGGSGKRGRLSRHTRANGPGHCAADDGGRDGGILEEREHRGIRAQRARRLARPELLFQILHEEREPRALRF
jgi:hypothetical protein